MKKNETKEINKFEELRKLIDKEKNEETKEKMLLLLNDIEIDHNRLKKSTDMKLHVFEIEKNLILHGYIKKDNDANYLYNRIVKIENSRSWKLYQKMKKVKNKIMK